MLSTKLLEAAGNSTQPTYIEDVFSTYLYTGNGSTQTITNGIDLSGKGGLNWTKRRVSTGGIGDTYHILTDTVRGANKQLYSNGADAQATNANMITSFNADGYSIGSDGNVNFSNASPQTYASWTFRKQPKFFDVVTYTGDGQPFRVINHNLQGTLGALFIKATSTTGDWFAWCRTETGGSYLKLNSTAAQITTGTVGTESYFIVGTNTAGQNTNASGVTYVAYLFAHNAGGFGLTGTDNVISCGSFTTDASGQFSVSLGYEPQWILWKSVDVAQNWICLDNMRGWSLSSYEGLRPNLSDAAFSNTTANSCYPTATGFESKASGAFSASKTYIYIAIRRGPMKVPTDGTKVFLPTTYASPGLNVQSTVTTNFPIDLNICGARGANNGYTYKFWFTDRLRVSSGTSTSNSLLTAGAGGTPNETAYNGLATFFFDGMTSYQITDSNGSFNGYSSGALTFGYDLRRAPGFFDEVCYTGNGTSARSITHNLGVTPQLIITKDRTGSTNWYVLNTFASAVLKLNLTDANNTGLPAYTYGNGSAYVAPTSSAFTVDVGAAQGLSLNWSGDNYVSYLFASCPGVSKVGSFTGNGSSQTINCGFTAGARFVMIKRTDAAGEWYVWDSARGIVPGNDPYLSFSSQNSEDWAGASDSVDADASGFIVNQNATNDVNVNGASYIYLAIA